MSQSTTLDRWLQRSHQPKGLGNEAQQVVTPTTQQEGEPQPEEQPRESLSHAGSQRSPLSIKQPKHPNVRFSHPQAEHVAGLRRLNSLLLPIPYPDSFYKEIISDPTANALTLLAFWHDTPLEERSAGDSGTGTLIGAVRGRLLDPPADEDTRQSRPSLYLSTLALLPPYRNLGVASQLFDAVVYTAGHEHGATRILAHVWEVNHDALEWYFKRGFTEIQFIPDYYRKLTPHGARVVTRNIGVLDLV